MAGGVVVTGASSGIGRETARALAAHDFAVFGTVRREADARQLIEEGISPILMDVTDGASIAEGRKLVESALGDRPLVGLVNNAGVPAAGPLEFLPLEALRRVLEVNVIGVVAVTQAFLPLLRRAGGRGRIVNISSVSGRIAMPFAGPYSASKFALEALSDSLRRELAPSGVRVSVIEPGSVRTPIWDKIGESELSRYRDTPYAPLLPLIRDQALAGARRGLPPQAVATAVLEALTSKHPRARVVVVRRRWRFRMLRWLPDAVLDRLAQRALWRR